MLLRRVGREVIERSGRLLGPLPASRPQYLHVGTLHHASRIGIKESRFAPFQSFSYSTKDVAITTTKGKGKGKGKGSSSIKKPIDQIREEHMRDLQAEIAFHHKHGQYDEALKVSETLVERSSEHFGVMHPVTASAYNNVGLMQKYLGKFVESRGSYHKALTIYKEILGDDHSSFAAALNNLGNLYRAQSQMDETLSAIERLQMNQAAIEYFEDALQIRTAELGKDHSQTVTSHSNLGAAMASMLLQEQANRNKVLNTADPTGTTDTSTSPWKVSKLTKSRWEAAEHHLRTALNTALKNPRGEKVEIAEKPNPTHGATSRIFDIQTLSAAGAAQNLAVFLKSKADMVRLQQSDSGNKSNIDTDDMHAEALNLYHGALFVRKNLLSASHPDTVATKFSLAELMSAAFQDEEGANALRKEILEAYSVVEADAPVENDGGSGNVKS